MRNASIIEFVRPNQHLLRLLFLGLILLSQFAGAQPAFSEEPRCASLELFIRNDDEENTQVIKRVKAFAEKNGHIKLHIHNLDEDKKHDERFQQILKYFHLETAETPALYGCNYLLRKLKPDETTDTRIQSLLTVSIYTRTGCAKCAAAKEFLPLLKEQYPVFQYKIYDIVSDNSARERVQKLSERYGKQAVSVPVFHFCNKLIVGWVSEQSTGQKLEETMQFWTKACPKEKPKAKPADENQSSSSTNQLNRPPALKAPDAINAPTLAVRPVPVQPLVLSARVDTHSITQTASLLLASQLASLADDDALDPPPPALPSDEGLPPIPGGDSSPPPLPFGQPPVVAGEKQPPPALEEGDTIEVPFLGELSQSRLGMPAFTFLIGLVDGFNPCAMWVLLFLLSLLVNLKSRAKIVAVAGTFVLISGLAYLAFMAAWLNVFLLIGYLPTVQFLLGLFAVMIGLIHVKDYFAFKKGISLSIPEWAKPGLYARMRRIVNAENLTGAIIGASILAVLVNIIELLCTAGLPALYTEILTMQNYPAWKSYSYLCLYIVAYMLDDTIMVTIVVVTLGRHKLQETQGRYLKLFSGVVILLLGLVLIIKPSLLF
ncbi:glutaredoxin domain-containing protein [Gimesia fumaroli]|uniref:Glutaredoxin n=1 Tax=Gimesia fumaroli TaxID=2527976 RepID=A0A518IAI0_9PLAN|nr:glutaredoxin domain-containing protein [Gimesia fumaroli]QDV50049.1 Glutaredoxin [Gimesia fumaroli]